MRQQVVDSVEAEGELSSVLLMLNVSITPISFILQYHMLPRSNYLKPWLQESNSKLSIGKNPSNKKIEINFNLTETRARIYIYIYIYIFFFLPQLAIVSQSRGPIPFSLRARTTPLASTCHTVVTYWNNRFTWSRYCGREQIESGLARSVTGSLGCTSWVHNVLITVMTNNVVDIVQTTINQSPFFNWIQLLFL